MVKVRELSAVERAKILTLRKTGMKLKDIALALKCSISTVNYTLKKYNSSNETEDKRLHTAFGRGRKKILNNRNEKYLKIIAIRVRRKSVPQLTNELSIGIGRKFLESTIRRTLITKFNLFGRVACRKPYLKPANVRKRLQFAREHLSWTLEQWHQVLWTDEFKFELFGTKRRVYVRRSPGERYRKECLLPTVKHGGKESVIVWGAISANGVAALKKIEGIMDKHVYHNILVRHAIPAGKCLIGNKFLFQEDNDPKHASKLCRGYLEKKEKLGNYL